jgi:hypothetical protein
MTEKNHTNFVRINTKYVQVLTRKAKLGEALRARKRYLKAFFFIKEGDSKKCVWII